MANPLTKIWAGLKWLGKELEAGMIKLFGAQEVEALAQSVEAILKTDLGQELLSVGATVAAGVEAGTSPTALILKIALEIVPVVEKAGISLAESVYHMLAAMIVTKLTTTAQAVNPTSTVPAS